MLNTKDCCLWFFIWKPYYDISKQCTFSQWLMTWALQSDRCGLNSGSSIFYVCSFWQILAYQFPNLLGKDNNTSLVRIKLEEVLRTVSLVPHTKKQKTY
jgi:hypothetical protein